MTQYDDVRGRVKSLIKGAAFTRPDLRNVLIYRTEALARVAMAFLLVAVFVAIVACSSVLPIPLLPRLALLEASSLLLGVGGIALIVAHQKMYRLTNGVTST